MNDLVTTLLLLSVPGLPLLLAFPALRARLRRPGLVALLPAALLALLPVPVTASLPWLLLGSRLGTDATGRWLLAAMVLTWLAASLLRKPDDGGTGHDHRTTFFLLTQAGALGVVLAMDPAGFLAFSTVAGYGFYALLISTGGGGGMVRRGGLAYLVLLILADMALFEALLIVAAADGHPEFSSLPAALARSDSRTLYLAMVLVGFGLKAGIWPFHFWVRQVYGPARPVVAILLPGVPLVLALYGALRWLPPDAIRSAGAGWVVLGVGLATMLAAIPATMGKTRQAGPLVPVTLLATGIFTAALGMALAGTATWSDHGRCARLFLATFGPAMALLVLATRQRAAASHAAGAPPAGTATGSWPWAGQIPEAFLSRLREIRHATPPGWLARWRTRAGWLATAVSARQQLLDTGEKILRNWSVAMTLFLLLGAGLVLAGLLF